MSAVFGAACRHYHHFHYQQQQQQQQEHVYNFYYQQQQQQQEQYERALPSNTSFLTTSNFRGLVINGGRPWLVMVREHCFTFPALNPPSKASLECGAWRKENHFKPSSSLHTNCTPWLQGSGRCESFNEGWAWEPPAFPLLGRRARALLFKTSFSPCV